MSKLPRLVRPEQHLYKVVFVDGLPGCGKTMLSAIVAALDRVELLSYSSELENVCALRYLNKITEDAAISLIQTQTDLMIYQIMMSRNLNFRYEDLSSAFQSPKTFLYLKRIFQKGNEAIPDRIARQRPILNIATHQLLAFSMPIFQALGDKAVFIEVVRHPLYMVKQQALNYERAIGTSRHSAIYISSKQGPLPFFCIWMGRSLHQVELNREGCLRNRRYDPKNKDGKKKNL